MSLLFPLYTYIPAITNSSTSILLLPIPLFIINGRAFGRRTNPAAQMTDPAASAFSGGAPAVNDRVVVGVGHQLAGRHTAQVTDTEGLCVGR